MGCELELVTHFQQMEYEKGENSNFTLEKQADFILTKWSRFVLRVADEALHLYGVLPQNPPRKYNQETNNRETQLESLQSIWPLHLETVKITKTKGRLRSCCRLVKTKETSTKCNVWYSGLGELEK